MTEYLEVKQPNISQIAESFINTNTNNEINPSSSNNIENSENSNLFNISFLRELRPFKCNFPGCNRDYSNKSRLEIHVRTHVKNINISFFFLFLFSVNPFFILLFSL